MVFAGIVAGTSKPDKLTCEHGGSSQYRSYAVLMEGSLNGRPYFLRLNAYPYHGAGIYHSVYRPPELLTDYATPPLPDPLQEPAPVGYPAMGFLNFLPKSDSSYGAENRDGTSSLTVNAGELSGSLVAELVQSGAERHLRVVGSFVCGPPFNP